MIEGMQIGGYRVLRQIGEGGMGAVWLAEHAMLGRRAAIKVLHPLYSAQPGIVARFFNEAKAATAIADPGIVQIFDFGHHTDGSAYIVMELLDGEPLDKRLHRLGVMRASDMVRILRQVAGALGAAHAADIVHRDLKPENIFVVRDPAVPGGERAKILDFGIAKLSSEQSTSRTATTAMMGTPLYMSPEQCRGAGYVDARSDIYSLGCMMFALLTGRPPFLAEGAGDLIALHLRELAPRVSSIVPGVSRAVDALVARCLAKSPDERPASGAALAAELDALDASTGADFGRLVAQSQPAAMPVASASTTLGSSALAISSPKSRGGSKLIVAGVAVVLISGGIATWSLARGGERETHAVLQLSDAAVAVAPVPAAVSSVATPAAPVDERPEVAKRQLRKVVLAFIHWSATHVGQPCPSADELGNVVDPWGHALAITCIDQPADQIIGVSSLGPDGIASADDLHAWLVDPELADLLRGPHWSVAITGAAIPTPHSSRPTSTAHTTAAHAAVPRTSAPVVAAPPNSPPIAHPPAPLTPTPAAPPDNPTLPLPPVVGSDGIIRTR